MNPLCVLPRLDTLSNAVVEEKKEKKLGHVTSQLSRELLKTGR